MGALEEMDYSRWNSKKIKIFKLENFDDKDSFMCELKYPINIEFGKIFK